jgi:Pup amidohydrolase
MEGPATDPPAVDLGGDCEGPDPAPAPSPGARIVGLETELALGFQPARPGTLPPTQETLFRALLRALKGRLLSCEALYYKGGDFLQNGSLIHFEVSRLDAPQVGLLEWSTPECLGPAEAAVYDKAQEQALIDAVPDAEADLRTQGFEGSLFLLKNNCDRQGNPYGCHESYDVGERFPPTWSWWLLARVLHPLSLLVVLLLGVAMALPLVGLGLALLGLAGALQLLGLIPGLSAPAYWLRGRLRTVAEFLVEVSPTFGSGIVAHTALWFLRAGGVLFSLTASRVIFAGHLPALLPFLVTRPLVSGAGTLTACGRLELTPRAAAIRRGVSAFVFGPSRPLVDLKEYFYRHPLSFRKPRKRLHLLAGDSNRSEYATLLKLSTTCAVLDAIEAGALDGLARRLRLHGGPLTAFRLVSRDLSFSAPVARDRLTGQDLTALDVQRLYLEATWEHFRTSPQVPAETKDALVRWGFVLERLADDPRTLDNELDWAIKRRLMEELLADELPGAPAEEGWALLSSWGPILELVERWAPRLDLEEARSADDARTRLRDALGRRRYRRLTGVARRSGLDLGALPGVRRIHLRLRTVDLKYHELSREGGYYDWLLRAGRVARVLDPTRLDRAASEPPPRTRAAIRADFVRRYAHSHFPVRVGWERIVIEQRGVQRTVRLDDPYRFELEEPRPLPR